MKGLRVKDRLTALAKREYEVTNEINAIKDSGKIDIKINELDKESD